MNETIDTQHIKYRENSGCKMKDRLELLEQLRREQRGQSHTNRHQL